MIKNLIVFNFKSLIRNKLILFSFLILFLSCIFSWLVARVSFVDPYKIYWSFNFSIFFIIMTFLSIILSTRIFEEQKVTKMLTMIVASGVKRKHWLFSQFLSITLCLLALAIFWFILSWFLSLIFLGNISFIIFLQATLLIFFECFVIVPLGIFLGSILRSTLAFFASFIFIAWLHSYKQLESIFESSSNKVLSNVFSGSLLLHISKLLPPLHWFDIKALVPYVEKISWLNFFGVGLIAMLWCSVFLFLASATLKKLDL